MPGVLILALTVLVATALVLRPDLRRRVFDAFAAVPAWAYAAAALICLTVASRSPAPPLVAAIVMVVALFVREWCQEFLRLMGLPDDAFPGRRDKLVWGLLMILVPPIGLWTFRAFRRARWPEVIKDKPLFTDEFD